MTVSDQEQALLDVVEAYRSAECKRLRAEAEVEAAGLLLEARREARRRVHRAAQRERERAAVRIRTAQAELNTRRREHQQRLGWALLEVALGQLEQALLERWGQAGTRRLWIEATLERALTRLPSGPWVVRHPLGWPEAERTAFHRSLVSKSQDRGVDFQPDEAVRAGLIISSDGTSLDASVQGLFADREAIEAELLAYMAEGVVQ